MGLYWFWHHLFILLLEETLLFTTKRVCKIQFLTKICKHYPMLTLHIAGLRVYSGKSAIVRSWKIVWQERTEVPKFEQRDVIDILLQSKIIHFYKFFPTTPNLSTATHDIRSPNTMSCVRFSRGWVKNYIQSQWFSNKFRITPKFEMRMPLGTLQVDS